MRKKKKKGRKGSREKKRGKERGKRKGEKRSINTLKISSINGNDIVSVPVNHAVVAMGMVSDVNTAHS